jgi:hypothetical protein
MDSRQSRPPEGRNLSGVSRLYVRYVRFRVPSSPFPALIGLAALALVGLLAIPCLGGAATAAPATTADALPRAAERLAKPVWLPHCQMNVVEWRSTPELRAETTPSEQAYALLDDTCRRAFERYGDFLRAKKLPRLRERPDRMPSISLLPGNVLLDGKSRRALNDLPSRFEGVAPGCCYWGLYVDTLDHLFLRNDPLIRDANGALQPNPRFVRTLTHEMGHILSARLGVWDAVGYDRDRDEELAEAFVAFMGMTFPPESSAEDLSFHQGHLPFGPPKT